MGYVAWISLSCLCALPAPSLGSPRAGLASTQWQLELRFQDPQRITVRLPGETTDASYWYLVYEVVNNTGRDIQFYPSFKIVTNTLKVVDSGVEVSPSVVDWIVERHRTDFPFFTSPNKVSGLLLQGEENARASVAVFRPVDPEASSFTLYASGLSGESTRIPNPAYDPSKADSLDNAPYFVLRRTLAVTYDLPGDPKTRAFATPIRRSREWVMR